MCKNCSLIVSKLLLSSGLMDLCSNKYLLGVLKSASCTKVLQVISSTQYTPKNAIFNQLMGVLSTQYTTLITKTTFKLNNLSLLTGARS